MNIQYKTFKIPKNTGGWRTIEQPDEQGMEYLKTKLEQYYNEPILKPSYFAHAFVKGRNIVTCAKQHHGNNLVCRIDIKDFFNSITYDKFVTVFFQKVRQYISYNNQAEIQKEESLIRLNKLVVEVKDCFKDGLYLPQGSPTSPLLSNAYMRFFDWSMAWNCFHRKAVYNRYADDIYISVQHNNIKKLHGLRRLVDAFLVQYQLEQNNKKFKIMKQGKRMSVVGVVINDKINIPKKTRRIIRAILHNAERDSVELTPEQQGLISFQHMVLNEKRDKPNSYVICGQKVLMDKL